MTSMNRVAPGAMQSGLGRIVPQRGQLLDQQVSCFAGEHSREQLPLARPIEIHRALADATIAISSGKYADAFSGGYLSELRQDWPE